MDNDIIIGDNMPEENGYVRQPTCNAIHKGIDDKLGEIQQNLGTIIRAVNPKVQQHEDWIVRYEEAGKKQWDVKWKVIALIMAFIGQTGIIAGIVALLMKFFTKR